MSAIKIDLIQRNFENNKKRSNIVTDKICDTLLLYVHLLFIKDPISLCKAQLYEK